jgi:dihydrofolate reductase
MRKLIVTEFVSLDGVMEAPGGEPDFKHSGWVFEAGQDEGQGRFKFNEVLEADAHLLGRVTYEGFAAAWPKRSGEFADKLNAAQKYVVSSTLEEPLEWENSTLLSGDVPEAVAELKQQDGGNILVAGSRTLVHTLIEHDLVDEYHVMVFPVILGTGRRLFPDDMDDKRSLKLADTQVFDNGVVVHTYHPAG